MSPPVIHVSRVLEMAAAGCPVDEIVRETGAPKLVVQRKVEEVRLHKLAKSNNAHRTGVSKYLPYKDEIKGYLRNNLTSSQIAERLRSRLPGTTRNAVISAVHRLDLYADIADKPRPPKKRYRPRPANSPQRAFNPTPASVRVSQADRLRAILTTDECRDIPADIPVEARVPLQELTDKSCRWPAGDPRSPDFGFCGAQRVAGLPYCECHSRRAFQPPTSPGAQRTRKNSRHVEKTLADA